MAAKSPKKPRAKAPAKKVQHKATRKAKATPQLTMVPDRPVEVVTGAPNLMPPKVRKQLDSVEELLGKAETLTDPVILKSIRDYASQADRHRGVAVQAGASALVYAWACGTLLNVAKEKLGHGAFGKWRSEHLVPHLMSERTSTRYMHLAASCHDVRALLEWSPGLRQSYIACGVLPDSPATDRSGGEKEEVPRKEILFTGLSNLQRNLRLFEKALDEFDKSKEKLSPDDKRQLHLMNDEIGKFTDRILKLLP